MFTDKFLKIPIQLYSKKEADIVGYTEDTKAEKVKMRIDPSDISTYRQSFNEDAVGRTLICMKCGENFVCDLHIREFEKLLNNHELMT